MVVVATSILFKTVSRNRRSSDEIVTGTQGFLKDGFESVHVV
jgi:hypothetical protein